MNTHDDTTAINETLLRQLRALRRDEATGRDLWPGIAAALNAQTPTRRRRTWPYPAAMAASVLLVVGTLGWQQATRAPATSHISETLVQREADGLSRQYQAALLELAPAAPAGSLQPTIAVLDRDVTLIREALQLAPNSRLLLAQLRRTYAHRLALAQLVAYR